MKIGNKVAYSVQFLRSIGEGPTSPMCHARGEITDLTNYGANFILATVQWDNPDMPDKVNTANLALVGLNSKFCAC
jgi:hypothetical protein